MNRPRILLFILRRCRRTSQKEEHLEGILGIWRLGAPGIPKRPVCSFIYRPVFEEERAVEKDLGKRAGSAAVLLEVRGPRTFRVSFSACL